MICCEHCETDACLTLIDGVLEARAGELAHARPEYRCERYGLTGTLAVWGQVPEITGALVRVESRGTPIDDQRPLSGGDES